MQRQTQLKKFKNKQLNKLRNFNQKQMIKLEI